MLRSAFLFSVVGGPFGIVVALMITWINPALDGPLGTPVATFGAVAVIVFLASFGFALAHAIVSTRRRTEEGSTHEKAFEDYQREFPLMSKWSP
jgi:ABC-type amino acid transport system permease subunit